MARQLMQVTEPFSGTLEEDGMVEKPVLNKDGGRVYREDGSFETKLVKGKVRVPVTLNPGKVLYPSDHVYVKTWPQYFQPADHNAAKVE